MHYMAVHAVSCLIYTEWDLFASTLLFQSPEQLRLAGEVVGNTLLCCVEHCFTYCMQDALVANVTAVRPFLPSKVFVKDNNKWRAATEVYIYI